MNSPAPVRTKLKNRSGGCTQDVAAPDSEGHGQVADTLKASGQSTRLESASDPKQAASRARGGIRSLVGQHQPEAGQLPGGGVRAAPASALALAAPGMAVHVAHTLLGHV
jgi:hypothetical protein